MSEQKEYEIAFEVKHKEGWRRTAVRVGDTWQEALHGWLEDAYKARGGPYQILSEKPSDDGRSGIMEISEDPLPTVGSLGRVKATLREYD